MKTKAKIRTKILRLTAIAVCIIPFLVFFLPPNPEMRVYFHGQEQDGLVQIYRSDDAVGYYFRGDFRINPGTTSAYMKNVHENLQDFRMRFTDVPGITIDKMTLSLYAIPIFEMTGADMVEQLAVKNGLSVAADGSGMSIETRRDGAYFILKPQTFMSAGAWALYILILFVIALPLGAVLTGLLFLAGVRRPVSEALFPSTPAFVVVFGELACGSISAIPTNDFILNYFFILGIEIVLRFLTRRNIAAALTGGVFSAFYIANHFVFLFRGRPLLPWDLQAIGTAAEVAGSYTFEMTGRVIALIIVAVLLVLLPRLLLLRIFSGINSFRAQTPLAHTIPDICEKLHLNTLLQRVREMRPLYLKIIARLGGVLLGVLVIVVAHKSPAYAELSADSWDASIIIDYQKQGMPVTFLKFMETYRMSEPDGYSAEVLEEILNEYGDSALADKHYYLPDDVVIANRPERIIMVMNESLSEISYAPEEDARDTLPFYRSLTDNTIRGSIYVSVRGGGTCNTEFESLTASAMGFLPPNTYPYEAYLKRDTATVAAYFQSTGYEVAALHLADRKNWRRSTVYPYLGFDTFYAYDNYHDVKTLRGYATDACDYEKLIAIDESMREAAEENVKNFIFNVTMQNHGGYALTDDMTVTYELSEDGDFAMAEVYYSLMKLSDDAIRDLIAHYQEDETDTMIVIYGDHQPSLGKKADDFLFGENPPALDKYETPFVIWANYELPEVTIEKMSANYLPGLVIEAAGGKLTPYLRLAGDCFRQYPVITSYGVLDAEGRYYDNADAVTDETGIMFKYRCAQYNNLFDDNRMDLLFYAP